MNDEYHGIGEISYRNEDEFKGEWKDGKYHGKGEMIYANGDTELSFWRNGVKQ